VKRILTAFVLALCFASPALAQTEAQDAKTRDMLKKAAETGMRIDVNGNVGAEAVLIPRVDARRIFGKNIADNYAVVEVNVSNKSPDATLIIHNIYIDYSRWALSGATDAGVVFSGATTVEGVERDRLAPYHASNNPNRVASEEYRIVRGQLLDAQLSTRRNRILKWLSLAGTLASAYTFSLSEEGIIRGIAAYNGVAIPGLAATFPDAVIPQLNRVSDFGFQTNKVIPKQGGEVVVCFFPIDRFLTPGFRALFLKSPALFFAPLQMLVDKTSEPDLNRALGEDLGLMPDLLGANKREVPEILRESLPCYLRIVRGDSFNRATPDNSPRGQMDRRMDDLCLNQFGLERGDDNQVSLIGTKGTEAHGQTKTNQSTTTNQGNTSAANDGTVPTPEQRLARFLALDYLSQASLNNVRVTVDGIMTVDTMSIPAKVDEVTFDEADGCTPDQRCFWTVPADGSGVVRKGTIKGAYLTGGSVNINEAASLHIEDVQAVADGSSDQLLRFSMKLTKDVDSGKSLNFKVTKPRPGPAGTVDSQTWTYVVGFLNNESATLFGKVKYNAEARTLTLPVLDPKFNQTRFGQLDFSLNKPTSGTVAESDLSPKLDGGNVVLTLPENPDKGCWSVKVLNGSDPVGLVNNAFEVPPPPPTLDQVSIEANEIVATGTNLIDNRACSDMGLVFQLVKDGDDEKDADLKDGKIIRLAVDDEKDKTATSRHLKLPTEAKPGTKWFVQVRRGNDTVDKDHARKELEIK
jgi:hypothetical protein